MLRFHLDALRVEGYQDGPPSGLSSDDAAIAARVPCPACGQAGGAYFAVHREEPRSYRAFALCPR